MNPDFFVSVIIPVHNGDAFLADAVESIQRQGDTPLEIIIVDDGSTDGTAQLIPRLTGNIRAVAQSNRGPAAARNTGLRMARGNVIGFLDADDLWPANKLALQLACLADHPDIGIVQGRIQCIRTKDKGRRMKDKGQRTKDEEQPTRYDVVEAFADPYLGLQLGSALCRVAVFETVGGFDERLRHSEDVDWFLRAREQDIPMSILDQVTLLYRIHPHNMTRARAARDHYFIQALKHSLDRRKHTS